VTASDRDRALADLAREAAPDVLTAALSRAREDAVARLAALLSDEIVAQALGTHRRPQPDPGPEVASPPRGAATDRLLYAYAITRAGLSLPGSVPALTDEGPVRLVPDTDLALLVSPLAADALRVDEDDLSETGRLATLARGHDAVLRAAAACGPVLPLRFGTAVPDDEAARRLLREHATEAREQLDRIGDAREWGVRLIRAVSEPALAGVPRPARPEDISGTEYLARRKTALAEKERAGRDATQAADRLERVLAPHVTATLRRGGNPGASLLLDLACLVPPDSEAGFAASVAELAEELRTEGLDVELTGPWPPYSFASLHGPGGPR
jgi:hypothetical protein